MFKFHVLVSLILLSSCAQWSKKESGKENRLVASTRSGSGIKKISKKINDAIQDYDGYEQMPYEKKHRLNRRLIRLGELLEDYGFDFDFYDTRPSVNYFCKDRYLYKELERTNIKFSYASTCEEVARILREGGRTFCKDRYLHQDLQRTNVKFSYAKTCNAVSDTLNKGGRYFCKDRYLYQDLQRTNIKFSFAKTCNAISDTLNKGGRYFCKDKYLYKDLQRTNQNFSYSSECEAIANQFNENL